MTSGPEPTPTPTPSAPVVPVAVRTEAMTLLSTVMKAAEASRRPDLVARLRTAQARLSATSARVAVVGEFKKGKSSIVNSLIGAAVCPVDDDIATAVPTEIAYAEKLTLAGVGVAGDPPREVARELTPQQLRPAVTGNAFRRVQVGLPSALLKLGIVLIDTPGVGGLASEHALRTMAMLPTVHAVLFVSDATAELTEPELTFLANARKLCPTLVCVLAKTDIYPFVDDIVAADQKHLADAGIAAPVLAVSCDLRARGRAATDPAHAQALGQASGFAALETLLAHRLAPNVAGFALREAKAHLLDAIAQLTAPVAAAKQALSSPEGVAELQAGLDASRTRAEALRAQTSKWQTVLNDGITDLQGEVDHDLRLRTRAVMAEAEASLDSSDPAKVWEEFSQWLESRVLYEVTENYLLLNDLANALVDRVGAMFADDAAELGDGGVAIPEALLGEIVDPELPKAALKGGGGAVALSLFRNTYSSMSMFGSLGGSMMHLFVGSLNPVTLGSGCCWARARWPRSTTSRWSPAAGRPRRPRASTPTRRPSSSARTRATVSACSSGRSATPTPPRPRSS